MTIQKIGFRHEDGEVVPVAVHDDGTEEKVPMDLGEVSSESLRTEDLLNDDRSPDAVAKWDGSEVVVVGPDEEGEIERDADPATAFDNALSTELGDTSYRVHKLTVAESISGFDSTVPINVSPVIQGRGWDTVLEWDDGSIDGTSGSSQNFLVKHDGTVFRDFKYDGGDPDYSVDGYGILTEGGVGHCRFVNIYAVNVPGDAFGGLEDGTVVENCRAETFTEGGVEIVGAATARDSYLQGIQPIHLGGCDGAVVSGCEGVCEGTMGNQITGTVTNSKISDTVFDANGNDAPALRIKDSCSRLRMDRVTIKNVTSSINFALKADNATLTDCTIRGLTFENCDPSSALVRFAGDNNLFEGVRAVNSTNTSIFVDGIENVFRDIEGISIAETADGARTLVNGKGTNNGDPSAEGDWNGHADYAHKQDATVWNTSTSPSTPYKADENGNWVAV